jgi:hypothetical protein
MEESRADTPPQCALSGEGIEKKKGIFATIEREH